ncbi:winged helix-turn-helix domain-containing protein [Candidatus Pelagibacter sp.]|nr:winged helix-turn-helix domain-containing protein [Candidatus Pelagibacter sp.]
MNNQNIIVYRFNLLYQILKELEEDINFKIIEISDEKTLTNEIKNLNNYLIITKKQILKFNNQFVLSDLPIKIFKMIEKLNIEFLKHQFVEQSKFMINDYIIDINAREMSSKNVKLKLTEKEVNTIVYLSRINKPISINELQTNVWDYHSDIETHTVETHIYRLRKKISKNFLDDNFIISKNNGYQIK